MTGPLFFSSGGASSAAFFATGEIRTGRPGQRDRRDLGAAAQQRQQAQARVDPLRAHARYAGNLRPECAQRSARRRQQMDRELLPRDLPLHHLRELRLERALHRGRIEEQRRDEHDRDEHEDERHGRVHRVARRAKPSGERP